MFPTAHGIVSQGRATHAEPVAQEPFWGIAASSGGINAPLAERVGWQFQVGAAPIQVNALRFFATTQGQSERVTLHRVSDGAAIATADITTASETWVAAAVAPVTLAAGASYTISSRLVGGQSRTVRRSQSSVTYYAGITRTGGVFGADHNLPTSPTASVYAMVDFGYVT